MVRRPRASRGSCRSHGPMEGGSLPFTSPSRRRARRAVLPAAVALVRSPRQRPSPRNRRECPSGPSTSSSWPSTTSTATSSRPPARRAGSAAINAGGVEYLATHVRSLRATNPNTVVRLGRRPDRRQPAALGAVPRRADDRGDEPDRASTSTPSATTSSTRARRSCCGCRTAAATRSTAASTATTSRADFHFLAANVVRKDNGKTLFPPYKIRSFDGVEGRLHRHDPRGHADHRHPVRRRRPDFLDEAETVNALVPELQGEGRRDASSC